MGVSEPSIGDPGARARAESEQLHAHTRLGLRDDETRPEETAAQALASYEETAEGDLGLDLLQQRVVDCVPR